MTDTSTEALIPKERIAEWRELRFKGMQSAVGEYTPEEFWELLDAYEALAAEKRAAGDGVTDAVVEAARTTAATEARNTGLALIDATKAILSPKMKGPWRAALQSAALALQGKDAQDAKRYRWIRDESGEDLESPYVCGVHGKPMGDAGWLTGDHLDKAIDAAMDSSHET